MSKQFYLIKLYDDPKKYKDSDWDSLIDHIKNHDGESIGWSHHRAVGDLHHGRVPTVSLSCDSFKSALRTGEVMERILG